VRSAVKAVVETGLDWAGVTRLARHRMDGRVLVLAYHNVVPDGTAAGDLANHLPVSRFAAQLEELRATHDVIPLSEMMRPAPARGRPRVAITFDDAYRGAVTLGVDELTRRAMPATIFVAPAFVGGRSFWWDALATPEGLDPAVRTRALVDLAGGDEAIRRWAASAGLVVARVPDVACAASDEELARAAARPGVTLGSHSWSHPNLTRLAPSELAAELSRPREWLRARFANVIDWLAYPYGLHDKAVAAAAAGAGYAAAVAISGGWVPRTAPDHFAIPRVNIAPGLSIRGFALRAAGLLCD